MPIPTVQVAVINESTVVSDSDIDKAVQSLQVQVSRDFAGPWGIDATLQFVKAGTQPPAGLWWLVILDNSDPAGALGYHDLTNMRAAPRKSLRSDGLAVWVSMDGDGQPRAFGIACGPLHQPCRDGRAWQERRVHVTVRLRGLRCVRGRSVRL